MPAFLSLSVPTSGRATRVSCRPAQPSHPAGCTCCVARSEDALALDRLFLARVRGEVPWFRRVVVPADDPALRAALTADPVLSARFRLES